MNVSELAELLNDMCPPDAEVFIREERSVEAYHPLRTFRIEYPSIRDRVIDGVEQKARVYLDNSPV